MFARGLVVGKFSPLHLGHEFLLREAARQCNELYVISYSKPEYPGCDVRRRERWLQERFPAVRSAVLDDERLVALGSQTGGPLAVPANDAPDESHRDFVGYLCLRLFATPVDAVFSSEAYGEGFASHLTRYFRHWRAESPVVHHVLVDQDRRQVPISASRIRSDVLAQREWLDPTVAASFVPRACVLGGESSGKSSLAAAIADELGGACVAEYGRELWERRAGKLDFEDMLLIARRHIAAEEAAARKSTWVISDTSPLTTLFYSLDLFRRADPELQALAARRYDQVIVCAPDFPFVQDGTRRDAAFRAHQHDWYLQELRERNIPHQIASGTLQERTESTVTRLRAEGGIRLYD